MQHTEWWDIIHERVYVCVCDPREQTFILSRQRNVVTPIHLYTSSFAHQVVALGWKMHLHRHPATSVSRHGYCDVDAAVQLH